MKPPILFRLLPVTLAGALALALIPAASAQSASSYVTAGLEKFRQGDLDGAIAEYNKAIDMNSSYMMAYNDRGLARNGQGNFDGAIADYNQALKLKPGFAEGYFNRGESEFLQGNFDAAIADFTKTVGLRPDDTAAYFHRGLAREGQGNFEGASLDYAKALEMKSASDDAAQYLLLHSAMLGKRMGHGLDPRLEAATGWDNEWTRGLAAFINDKMSESDLMKLVAAAGGDERDRRENEALYFTGVADLIGGNKAAAKANFQKVYDATGPAVVVHRMARSELDHN